MWASGDVGSAMSYLLLAGVSVRTKFRFQPHLLVVSKSSPWTSAASDVSHAGGAIHVACRWCNTSGAAEVPGLDLRLHLPDGLECVDLMYGIPNVTAFGISGHKIKVSPFYL